MRKPSSSARARDLQSRPKSDLDPDPVKVVALG